MELSQEVQKLQSILRVPVTDIHFKGPYCEVYTSNNMHLGNVSTYSIAGILSYDTDTQILNMLNWASLYLMHREQIDEKVRQVIGKTDIEITLGTFRKLYVRDEEHNLIGTYECVYDTDWLVYKVHTT